MLFSTLRRRTPADPIEATEDQETPSQTSRGRFIIFPAIIPRKSCSSLLISARKGQLTSPSSKKSLQDALEQYLYSTEDPPPKTFLETLVDAIGVPATLFDKDNKQVTHSEDSDAFISNPPPGASSTIPPKSVRFRQETQSLRRNQDLLQATNQRQHHVYLQFSWPTQVHDSEPQILKSLTQFRELEDRDYFVPSARFPFPSTWNKHTSGQPL
ncbi:uncharacterized protein Z518_09589 [Rhinocladiella mackenziei CBS 650.93]|uniref:Uncharacterized protein n=1 Tax=Rhinocladiella mackenziei CBS 650.93 TaxID=1442369 RepID=A0A0D2FIK8_9EURO|nr:uncharacterized protein Z518_09589 [Rhinocladiella mackenziei CBS 650.93]KIX01862.1 hypothetical protein Z518_09589 [Rhinocladiella mackenziei CBS 650.93]